LHREVLQNSYTLGAGGYCLNAILPDDGIAVTVLANGNAQSFRGAPEATTRDVSALYSPDG